MTEERQLVDVLLDYGLYLPVGLLVQAAEELPKLSGKGRAKVASTVRSAGLIGRFAAGEARRRADGLRSTRLGAARAHAAPPAGPGERRSGASARSTPSGEAAEPPEPAKAGRRAVPAQPRARHSRPEPDRRPESSSGREGPVEPSGRLPAAESLAIPGYDVLAASQVVQRLTSLTAGELEEVRRYEEATRGRRTILHRIAQLKGAGRATD